jgi:tetratricopeptide (TPR) repeat protein
LPLALFQHKLSIRRMEADEEAKQAKELERQAKRAAIRARVEAARKTQDEEKVKPYAAAEQALFPLPRGFDATQACLLCTVLGAVLYLGALDAEFAIDDKKAVLANADVTGTDAPADGWLARLLANDFWGTPMSSTMSHKSYRPLTVLAFRLDHAVAGLSPAYFHAVNVLVYAAVCWLFTATAVDVLGGVAAGLGAGLLFAAHPVHSEAVCNVVGRAELLAGLFFLLSFQAYSRAASASASASASANSTTNVGAVLLALLYAAAAMVSKETGVTVVAVCLAYDAVRASERTPLDGRVTPAFVLSCAASIPRALGLGGGGGGAPAQPAPVKKDDDQTPHDEGAAHAARTSFVRRALLSALALGGLLFVRMGLLMHGQAAFLTLKHQNPAALHPDRAVRALHFSYIYARNAAMLLLPSAPLSYDWNMGTIPLVLSLRDPRNGYTAAFYAALVALVYAALLGPGGRATRRAATVGLAMLVFPFLPAANLLMPVGFVIAERTLFLPSMGACLLLGLLASRVAASGSGSGNGSGSGGGSLLRRVLGAAPLLVLVAMFGARTVERVGDWQTEERLYESCVRLLPTNANCAYNLATVRGTQKRSAEALQLYRTAVDLKPDFAIASMNLGNGYARTKRFEEAEHFLVASRKINPRNPGMLLNLANIFLDNDKARGQPWQRLDASIEAVEDAVRLQPNNARAQKMLASFTKNRKILAARAAAQSGK